MSAPLHRLRLPGHSDDPNSPFKLDGVGTSDGQKVRGGAVGGLTADVLHGFPLSRRCAGSSVDCLLADDASAPAEIIYEIFSPPQDALDPFDPDEIAAAAPPPAAEDDPAVQGLLNNLGQEEFKEPVIDLSSQGEPDAAEPENCAICQCPFSEGDKLRRFPCFHRFHADCTGRALQYSARCPVCKFNLRTGKPDES